ncbi:MAG: type II toxin-antitoxin system VapC family toxin [Chloroflexi bacterium]|nr:MAG: type II toxin-antitoxin system VapC family toxin [Chloroflexota bacterium]
MVSQALLASAPSLPTHRDPFDRLLIAQAIVEDLVLVTADAQLRRYPIRIVW